MGDAQSAQREERRDAAGEGEPEGGQDVQTEHKTEDKLLKHTGQFSEINGKADSSVAAINGHCEDDIAASEEVLSPNNDVMNPLEEETAPFPKDDSNDEAPVDTFEMEAKQNDMNETFRKFFSNIGVKLTVKRGSVENTATHLPEEETDRLEENYTTARQSKSDIAEHQMDANAAQEAPETDSTTCPTMTDGTSEDYIEMAEVKTAETQAQTDIGDVERHSPASETNQDATTEEEPYMTFPSIPDEEVTESPFKRFFTTGVFSGLRKKRKSTDNEITGKDLAETEEKSGAGTTEENEQDQPEDKQISQGTTEKELVENQFTEEIISVVSPQEDEAKSCSRNPSVSVVTESEILSSQEKDKVPPSPLKRLLSGSSLKRLSKKPRSRRSSDGKLSDSGEQASDHFLSSTESADIQKERSPSQASAEAPGVEDNAWASFKKLMTPRKSSKRPSLENEEAQVPAAIDDAKASEGEQISDDKKLASPRELSPDHILSTTESTEKQKESPAGASAEASVEEDSAWITFKKLLTPKKHMKRPSVGNEEAKTSNVADEAKPIEREQISDQSTEEGKKRKDSSVSWEAVLCGSGRRRSRKTSDSESETPQTGAKQGGESPLERSNEVHETPVSSAKEAESAAESDEGSTWKLFKKLVSPKRKAKDEDGSKDNQHSDSESTQDESFFSIKKLLPGRKKKKSVEKQDQETSDEADKDILSYDEDSETPAVVPLSEFDIAETGIIIQTEADIETYKEKETDQELQKDLLDETPEATLPFDSVQHEAEETLTNDAPTAPVTNEETSDATELVSKHQQLSDIPEEGLITETMATPASVYEEAVRDDTIADDLIEITSEAMTAPEPVDSTTADETEMISAVSQLSESSKTSGNTTPVPDENSDQDTEALLRQAAENISTNQNAVPVCSDELDSEGIVYSVWNSILKTFGKEKPKEGSASTGLSAETVDPIIDETTAAKTESWSDVDNAISTEIVSGVVTEESNPVEVEKGDLINDLCETNEAAFAKISPADETHETESAATEEVDHQVEKSELENLQNVTAEVQVGEHESGSQLLEKEKQISEEISLTEEVTNESEQTTTYLPEGAVEPEKKESQTDTTSTGSSGVFEVLEIEEAGKLPSAEDDLPSLRENVAISDYIPPEIVDTHQSKQPTEFPNEVITESKDNEASIGTPQTDEARLGSEESSVQSPHKESPQIQTPEDESEKDATLLAGDDAEQTDTSPSVSEVCKTVEANTSDIEPDGLKLPTMEIISGEIQAAKTITDETVPLTRENVEPESVPEEVQDSQAPPSDLEPSSPTSLEKESTDENEPMPKFKKMFQFILDVPAVMKRVKDEPKTEPVTTAETNDQDTPEIKNIQEPELPEAVPVSNQDSEESTNQLFQKENISEEIQGAETVPDETALITEGSIEPDSGLEALHPDQTTTLVSEPSSPKLPESEEMPEEVPSEETLKNESKEETQNEPMPKFKKMFKFLRDVPTVVKKAKEEPKIDPESPNKIIDPEDEPEIKVAQEPEVVEAVPASKLESEASSSQLHNQEKLSEEIQAPETVTDETTPLPGENVRSMDAAEVLEGAPAITLCSEPSSPKLLKKEEIPEDVPAGDISEEIEAPEKETDETTAPLPEENVKPVDTPEVIEGTPVTTLAPDLSSPELVEKEEMPDDVPAEETLRSESKEETQNESMPKYKKMFQFILDVPAVMKKVIDEPKNETEPPTEMNDEENDPKINIAQESELVEAVQASILDSEVSASHLLDEEITSDEIKASEKVTDETTPLPEENVESMDSPEESQGAPTALVASEPSSPVLLEKEEIPEDIPAGDISENIQAPESVSDETIPLVKENTNPEDAPEVIESAAAAASDSGPTSPTLIESEDSSKDGPEEETVKNQPTEETQNEPTPKYKKLLQFILDVPAVVKNVTEEPINKEIIDLNVHPDTQDVDVSPAASDSEPKSPKLLKNEDISDEIQTAETETAPHTEGHNEPPDAPDMLEAAETATLESEPGSPTLLRKQEISDDEAAALPNEPKEETQNEPLPKYKKMLQFILDAPAVMKKVIDESKNEPPKIDADPMEEPNTDHVQSTEKSEAVSEATSDSTSSSPPLLEKEAESEDVPLPESVEHKTKEENQVDSDQMEASKIVPVQEEQMQAAVAPLDLEVPSSEVHESKIIPAPEEETEIVSEVELVADSNIEHFEKTEVLQAAMDSNAAKEEILEDAAEEETTKDQMKEETPTVISELVREPKMSEALQTLELEKSEEDPQIETHPVEADKETVSLTEDNGEPVDATKINCDEKTEVFEAAVLDSEIANPQLLDKEEISEDVSALKTITDEPKQVTDVKTEQEELPVEPEASSTDVTRTVVETEIETKELESTQNIEQNDAQEKPKLPEDDLKPAGDDVIASDADGTENKAVSGMDETSAITQDHKTESTQLDSPVEHEETITSTGDEMKTQESCVDTAEVPDEPTEVDLKTAVEQAGEIECDPEDVSAVIPDVSILTSSEIPEPPIATIASETELVEPIETTTQLGKDNIFESVKESGEVVLMHAPSVELEDNHRIQVQVVDVDVEAAEGIVETVLDVGVTEAKEIVDVCPKTITEVENLSATVEVEKEVTVDDNTVTVQVIQQAKNLPEAIPESEDVSLEQQAKTEADNVEDESEKVGEESSEQEVENVMKEGSEMFKERPFEEQAMTSESSVMPEQPANEEQMSAIVESIISDDKQEDLVETKGDMETSEVLVLAEDGTSSTNGTEAVDIQNIVPSDVESPSATLTIISDETRDNMNQTDTSGVKEETAESEKTTQEALKQGEETKAGGQETGIKEAEENLDSTERAAITNQPLDVNTEATETIETAEQIKCTETVTADLQTAETTQSTTQIEKTDDILCDEGSQVEELTRKTENEENDQDVWLDAEEDIYSPEGTEESTPEFESLSNSKTEDDQQEQQKTEGVCETESDGEDFAIALEDLETAIVPTDAVD